MDLNLNKVTKYYGSKKILHEINIDVKKAKVLSLIGPSGSGKSTLLRLIAGLEDFQGGTIEVNGFELTGDIKGKRYTEFRKKVGFVFQDHNLFNHLTVLENICLVLEQVHKKSKKEAMIIVEDLLEQFGLADHKEKYPHQISGGQSQRVSIVRALAIEPDIILLDEPTSSLDPVLTYEVLSAIDDLVKSGKNVVLVTHEIGFAREVADFIVYMEEGNIIEYGHSEMFDNPRSDGLKSFLDKVLSFHAG